MKDAKRIAFEILHNGLETDWPLGGVVEEQEDYISVDLGIQDLYINHDGFFHMQKDYRVDGEVWQVHKYDADPFPSRPHAHCVGGRANFVSRKLHLGTRQLYRGSEALDLFLHKKPFMRLIELIRPKFPEITLPIPLKA
jgi:hypothetical protein